jgi:hypothetical protein
MAVRPPALVLIPDGGSPASGSYVATVAGRGVEAPRWEERPRDVVLQRPIDPAHMEDLLGTVFGPPAPHPLPHGRAA